MYSTNFKRNSCWSTETKCKKQKHDKININVVVWENRQMKEKLTLHWRSTYEHEDLDKQLQMFYAEVRTKYGFFYNFVENIVNKKIVWLLVHFVI